VILLFQVETEIFLVVYIIGAWIKGIKFISNGAYTVVLTLYSCVNLGKMLIRLLIFSTLVLAVNLVAGIFAKDQTDRDFSTKNQHHFYVEGRFLNYALKKLTGSCWN
jgi:hypothetical protein